jgi:hypothetical protein
MYDEIDDVQIAMRELELADRREKKKNAKALKALTKTRSSDFVLYIDRAEDFSFSEIGREDLVHREAEY